MVKLKTIIKICNALCVIGAIVATIVLLIASCMTQNKVGFLQIIYCDVGIFSGWLILQLLFRLVYNIEKIADVVSRDYPAEDTNPKMSTDGNDNNKKEIKESRNNDERVHDILIGVIGCICLGLIALAVFSVLKGF